MDKLMRRLIVVSTVLALLAAAAVTFSPPRESVLSRILDNPIDRAQGVEAELRSEEGAEHEEQGEEGELEVEPDSPGADWLVSQRLNDDGMVPGKTFRRALYQAKAAENRTAAEAPALAAAEWQAMGPTNIGGRIVDAAVDPLTADTLYAATASGGVWKSTDAGMTWSYSWPDDLTQSMGALAVGSDGVLYAGTGESNPGGGSITYGGTGLYRSTDHGATWQFAGLPTSGAFGRIVVDPTDPSHVLAAASGDLYTPGGERGLYESTDGGDSWTRILEGTTPTTGASDIALDPANPNNILVAMWDHHRLPTHRVYAGEGSGVWRSTDGGDSWTKVGLPLTITPEEVGRIGVVFAPSTPSRAYAIVASNMAGSGVGLYRSNDGGATFTKTAVAGSSLSQSTYGWWFGRLWVDPSNPQTLWIPGVSLLRSTNGGDSVATVSGPHSDQHTMVWDPRVPGRVYLGNDGGMYRSSDNGSTWTAATRQGWTQSYSVDVGELTSSHVVTGLQDNGCVKNWTSTVAGPDQWTSFGSCGDGLETLINPQHEQTMYACSQYGSCGIAVGGAPAGVPMTFTSDRKGWWTPIIFDPTNSLTMYFGGNRVNRSTNGGLTWTAISGDLSKNEPQEDPNSGYRIRGVITALAASKSSPDTVWAGTDDGLVWKTTNVSSATGPTWTRIDNPALPDAWVTRITIDPADANKVYVTYSGYRGGDDSAHVLRSTNGGATWTDISGDLPAAPVSDLLVIGNRLVAASDVGVYLSDGSGTWYRLGSNLPTVPVIELRYHSGTNTITAATFGHGIQRITLP